MSSMAFISGPFGLFDQISMQPNPFALKASSGCWKSCESQSSHIYRPAIDIIEDQSWFKVIADLPGFSKDSIQISFTDNALTISGQSKIVTDESGAALESEDSKAEAKLDDGVDQAQEQAQDEHTDTSEPKTLLKERLNGRFSRTFRFHERADLTQTTGTHVDGVLRLVIPKRAPLQSSILIR